MFTECASDSRPPIFEPTTNNSKRLAMPKMRKTVSKS